MKNDFINEYGLLNAKRSDINAENAPLWSLELYLLNKDRDILTTIENYIYLCKTDISGLYNQIPPSENIENKKDSYMSPDQLIAFVGALYLLGRNKQIKKIWSYLIKHFFTYDNLSGKTNFNRIMQPGAVFFVGACSGNMLCRILLPLVLLYSVYDKPDKTSGKIKSWVMFKTLNMKITEYIANYIILKNKHMGSWYKVFKTYFYEKGHPIPEEFEK